MFKLNSHFVRGRVLVKGWKIHVLTVIFLRGMEAGRVTSKLSFLLVLHTVFSGMLGTYVFLGYFSPLTHSKVSLFLLLPNSDRLQDWKIMAEVAHDN